MGSWVDGGRQPVLGGVVGYVADQEVITWSAVEQVAVLTAEQTIVAGTAEQDVGAEAANDEVVAGSADAFNAHILETGTQSYRLATSKTRTRSNKTSKGD